MKNIIPIFALTTSIFLASCAGEPAKTEVIVVPAQPEKTNTVVIEKEPAKKTTTISLDKKGVKVEAKDIDVSIDTK
ncbi:MAG: hypothetical protein R2852_07445 [Bacteroidia bacterium]